MTRAGLFAISLVLVACAGDQAPERRCTAHSQCDDGFLCGPAGLCTPSTACTSDGDCCPGAVCFSGWCRPTSECGPDRACAGLGEVCENTQCVPAACDGLAGCPEPFACVSGRCLLGPPCGGACPEGAACDVVSDRCTTLPAPCRCEQGFATVVGASDGLSCERTCSCAPLPAVPPGRPGVWGGLLSDGRTVLGYEPEYGDLVGSRFEVPAELSEVGNTREGVVVERVDLALDGLPEAGPVLSDDVYRGGRLDPGPDRGDRPVLLEDGDGLVHAFYRDHDTNRLRYGRFARGPGDPTADLRLETSHLLPVSGAAVTDEAQPDLGVGRFSCLVPRPGGTGGLGGLVFVGADSSDGASLLVRVESRVDLPLTEADWVATTVLETPLPPREDNPCGGSCGLTEACVVAPSGAHGCAALLGTGGLGGEPCLCGAREVCGEVEGVRRCHPRVEPRSGPDRLPYGEGLFVSCATTASGVAAAWYDADQRRLVAARWPFGAESREVVDAPGQSATERRDPGHFAHLMASGDALAIAYQDAATGELRVARQAGPGRPWSTTIVPAGPGEHGLWVRGVFSDAGIVLVAGEGQTRDIMLFSLASSGSGGCWASRRALTSGAFAYPDLRVEGASAWVSARALVLDEELVPRHGPVLARVGLPTACP